RLDAIVSSFSTTFVESRDELGRGAEEQLIWRVPLERRVRDDLVVLLDVERDESCDRGERVELVKEEPTVLQRSPERFDHRVRERDVDLSEDATDRQHVERGIDARVQVLDAGIGEQADVLGTRI